MDMRDLFIYTIHIGQPLHAWVKENMLIPRAGAQHFFARNCAA